MTFGKTSFFLISFLLIVLIPTVFAQQNVSKTGMDENENTTVSFNFIPKSELTNLPDILTGYMTVISILIATDVFFVTTLQGFIKPETRKKYSLLSYALLSVSAILIGYGLLLIAITHILMLDIMAFLALIIPLAALWKISSR
jgi:hypothetical protein